MLFTSIFLSLESSLICGVVCIISAHPVRTRAKEIRREIRMAFISCL